VLVCSELGQVECSTQSGGVWTGLHQLAGYSRRQRKSYREFACRHHHSLVAQCGDENGARILLSERLGLLNERCPEPPTVYLGATVFDVSGAAGCDRCWRPRGECVRCIVTHRGVPPRALDEQHGLTAQLVGI